MHVCSLRWRLLSALEFCVVWRAQVRVFDVETGKVNRVKDDKVLGLGDIVLYPKNILFGGKTERQAALSETKLPPGPVSPSAHAAPTKKQRQQQQELQQQAAQENLVHTSQQQPSSLPTLSNYAPSVSLTQGQQSPSSHSAAPSTQSSAAAPASFPEPAPHHSTASPQHQPHAQQTSTPHSTTHPAERASTVSLATAEPSMRSQRQKDVGSSPSQRQHGTVPASAAIKPTPPSLAKQDKAPPASVASAVPDRPRVRSWMLGNTSDMVFVNKPAGVASMVSGHICVSTAPLTTDQVHAHLQA